MIIFVSKYYLSSVDTEPDEIKICYDKQLDTQENWRFKFT